MRSTVLGAGSWGTALASLLAAKGHEVVLWGRDEAAVDAVARNHENPRYLPGIRLPATLGATTDLVRALEGAEVAILAVPSHAMRQVASEARPALQVGTAVVSAAKGIEGGTFMTMSEVLEDVLPVALHPSLCCLGGPSFAREVARQLPTAVTIAGRWERVTRRLQEALHTRFFRPYTSTDVVGCEIGGCVKNVIAIAAGISDGMGFGQNARAALITRGLREMARLAMAKGANPMTLSGLAGLGDLVLTCCSELSRNRTVGFGLGQGRGLEVVRQELGQVVEGVGNARAVRELARALKVDMPIVEAVDRVLHEGLPARQAVTDLMMRETKAEM